MVMGRKPGSREQLKAGAVLCRILPPSSKAAETPPHSNKISRVAHPLNSKQASRFSAIGLQSKG
jgi:hypothetical protein